MERLKERWFALFVAALGLILIIRVVQAIDTGVFKFFRRTDPLPVEQGWPVYLFLGFTGAALFLGSLVVLYRSYKKNEVWRD